MSTPSTELTQPTTEAAPRPSFTNTPVLYPAVSDQGASTPTASAPTATATASAPAPASGPEPTAPPAAAPSTPVAPTSVAPAPAPTPAAPVPVAAATPAAAAPSTEKTAATSAAASEPEPENALTYKFSENERKALRAFRAELPKVLADAYVDAKEGTAPKVITIWGVTIDPTSERAKDARESVILMKFLRARNLNISAAHEMLVATLRWREEFGIAQLMQEKFDPAVFDGVAHTFGKDKDGHPVTYNIYGGKHDLKTIFGDVDRFIRWRVQFMEQSVLEMDLNHVDQMIQIHDYDGVSMTSRDANSKRAANEASSIFGAHYPEFIFKKFFVNVPSLMAWVFWAFKPLLPAATQAKMTMVGSGHHAIGKALLPYIEEAQLPKKYGGSADAHW